MTVGTIVLIFYAIVALALIAANLDKILPGEMGDNLRLSLYFDDCYKRGLDYHGAWDELDVRTEIVRLRREASDKVRNDPENWGQHIRDAIKSRADSLIERGRPDLAEAFTDTAKGLEFGHILYADETKLVNAQFINILKRPERLDPDVYTALRIVKPNY